MTAQSIDHQTPRRSGVQAIAMRSIPFLAVVGLWWLVTSGLGLVPEFKLPPPDRVIRSAITLWQRGDLIEAVASSALRMSAGFVAGASLGITLGLLVGANRHAATFISPLATFFQAIAGPAWIPLAVLWFGLSWVSVAFIVFNTVFFLVFYTTVLGVQTLNPNLVNSVRTLGGRRRDVLFEVLLPGALPSITNGFRVGIGYGWRALIAGEIIAGGSGLGVLIWEGQRFFRVADIVLGLLLIGIVSLIMEKVILGNFERRTTERWGVLRELGERA